MTGVLCAMLSGGSLTASASGSFFYGGISGAGTAVTTPACVITASSGSGTYTYAWTRTSGDASTAISSAVSSSVTWSRVFGPIGVADSVWDCVVTDSVTGATVTISGIQAQLERA